MSARDEGADPPACALFTWRSMRRVQGLVYEHLKTKTEQTKTYDWKYSLVNVDLICFCCFPSYYHLPEFCKKLFIVRRVPSSLWQTFLSRVSRSRHAECQDKTTTKNWGIQGGTRPSRDYLPEINYKQHVCASGQVHCPCKLHLEDEMTVVTGSVPLVPKQTHNASRWRLLGHRSCLRVFFSHACTHTHTLRSFSLSKAFY